MRTSAPAANSARSVYELSRVAAYVRANAPSPVVTRDAYPGGFGVFIRPAGLQCEDPIYNNADAAIADLQEAGIEIIEVSQVEIVVCEACGCPSSEQFRVSIDPADIAAALRLGWQRSYE